MPFSEVLGGSRVDGCRRIVSGVIAMAFGKRQSGVGPAAQALNVNTAVPQGEAVTESAEALGHPFRWFVALIAFGAMLYGLVYSYGPDIVRDIRLSGTWQPAYDLRATDGECKR